jgi:hypothetical protein
MNTFTYFKRSKPDGRWTEISIEKLTKTINAHYPEEAYESWDGSRKPSREHAFKHLHKGGTIHTYTAEYKATS